MKSPVSGPSSSATTALSTRKVSGRRLSMSSRVRSDSIRTNPGPPCHRKRNRNKAERRSAVLNRFMQPFTPFFRIGRFRNQSQDKESTDETQNNRFCSRGDVAGGGVSECQGFTRQEKGQDSQDGSLDPGRFV